MTSTWSFLRGLLGKLAPKIKTNVFTPSADHRETTRGAGASHPVIDFSDLLCITALKWWHSFSYLSSPLTTSLQRQSYIVAPPPSPHLLYIFRSDHILFTQLMTSLAIKELTLVVSVQPVISLTIRQTSVSVCSDLITGAWGAHVAVSSGPPTSHHCSVTVVSVGSAAAGNQA